MVPGLRTLRRPGHGCLQPRFLAALVSLSIVFGGAASAALVAASSAPPDPDKTSTVGQSVNNPVTSSTTTVSALIVDPVGTPTAGATAFVRTADGYIFLVKAVGEKVYNGDNPPIAFTILSKNTTTHTVQIQAPGQLSALALPYQVLLTNATIQQLLFPPSGTPGSTTPPSVLNGASGVQEVHYGQNGSNGRDGALVVSPDSGGNGATGPTVTYTTTFNISTTNQIGIEAGSVGGSGGEGGDSYASFWDGAGGGGGGAGGPVTITNSGSRQIATTGDNMHGIFAFSKGGVAGEGGSGYGAPGGGPGGHSSDGGTVTVTNNGTIITTGKAAFGIYGLSQSNNGGNGGSQWGLVGGGGSAGSGGNGGTVTITNGVNGVIDTSGDYGHGILAQSIGGSGGSDGSSGNLLVSLAGSPDNGGNGGQVFVYNHGAITTRNDDARGIYAQSIGGGGGSGSSSGGLIALGGSGSSGGSGAAVAVINYGTATINTKGLRSDAIFAQSVGGSGGSGSNAGGLVAVGGSGANAGSGGAVSASNFGTIVTEKNYSRGIVAQSIGGGGGDGGSSGGMVSVGGSGAGGGSSGLVTVTNGGSITTLGADAKGILVQSIGGGGGNGGSAGSIGVFAGVAVGGTGAGGGPGGDVTVTLQGQGDGSASLIHTIGARSTGLFAQSVGGGGGSGGGAVQVTGGFGGAASFAVGGNGGAGGDGGVVTLANGGGLSNIQTAGADATGVFLQSVGGGGGNGGYAVSLAVSGGPASGSISAAVGGDGGTAGEGGTVVAGSFNGSGNLLAAGFNGSILTTGDRSTGFFAQSVGGGGGNGGLAVSSAGSASVLVSGSISLGIGGNGGAGGAGGTVSIGFSGNIATTGKNSTALLAQSVGGGGGNGGGSIAAPLAASGGGAGTIGVAIGGEAGSGSYGGSVTLATRNGTISTEKENSTAIVAQSIGGSGGNGGYSVSAGGSGGGVGAASVNLGLGGKGGSGGDGGTVNANLQSTVTTDGQNSGGILVQSVGGGGGNGGFNISAAVSGAGAGSGAVAVGLGGSGGVAGDGGTVRATSTGAIATTGDRSSAFVAQSIGGGGGSGGYNVSAAIAAAGVGSGAVGVGLGGKGNSGGAGGNVIATTSTGAISTIGDGSTGVLAQSVGGGGGNGGFNVTGTGAGAGVGSGAVSVGLGGAGGAGGDAGTVTLSVTNNVSTGGERSAAVVAQSIGGGGGNGGFNVSGALAGAGVGSGSVSVGLGGNGATGGDAGVVNATVAGNISTAKESSVGILAQAVGGGGGNGGFNVSGALSGAGVGSGAVSVGLGGKGATAGDGGASTLSATAYAVTLNTSGTVLTSGTSSGGIVAQSIGGGGGSGGFNVSASLSGAGVGSGAVSVGLGGGGGSGGAGKNVFSSVASSVQTLGTDSIGVLTQSVGGGGGNGGFNVSGSLSGAGIGSGGIAVGLGGSGGAGGSGGIVTATATGSIITLLDRSSAFVAQSIGGGGGNGGFNVAGSLSGAGTGSGAVSVGLGGTGGTGKNGGAVTATTSGGIWTFGNSSTGILAQSVGGGGGNGGFNITAGASGAGVGSGSVGVGLGGAGGSGGTGGAVTLTVNNTVFTQGDNSFGVIAQSIGGSGGVGGFNVTALASGAGTGSGTVSVGLGGTGGAGSNAGAVVLKTFADILTVGSRSGGILAQSVGGGGGNGGFSVTVAGSGAGTGSGAVGVGLGGNGAGGGNGSSVDLTVRNNVQTAQSSSSAIVAQSVGGGGGNGGFNVTVAGSGAGTGSGAASVGLGGSAGTGGTASWVLSSVIGNVQTTGDNSMGLLAQSVGGGGGNGGFNVSASISGAGTGSGAAAVGIGGSGGSGGGADFVTSAYTGTLTTTGQNASGIIAQSLGGGGGNGGLNVAATVSVAKTGAGAVGVGIGGSGGGGGGAGVVTNTVIGYVQTTGDSATGILAQSAGGGGGSGGINVTGVITASADGSGGASIGIGGFGGSGGNGNTVSSTVTGGVLTTGAHSDAIVAQSLGGGGGNGAINVTGAVNISKNQGGTLGVGVGGFGGGGGTGGNVTVTVATTVANPVIQTTDDFSSAVVAQSLGGGGGNGGLNVTGAVNLTGQGGAAIGVGVGGFGGSGGRSGDVTGTITGSVLTGGANSTAIIVESIGGGGGNGGLNVTGGVSVSAQGSTGQASIGLGGFGGSGGASGKATLVRTGDTTTSGANSGAILVQSVAGGGGNGGINVSGGLALSSTNNASINIGVGGFGGGGASADAVSATIIGNVSALGLGAGSADPLFTGAVVAQSVGGGGGAGGLNVSGGISLAKSGSTGNAAAIGIGGFGGGGGNAGTVTLDIHAPGASTVSVATAGDNRAAVVAQSLGGGGGIGGINVSGGISTNNTLAFGMGGFGGTGGTAATVTASVTADIQANGDGSRGILAQSLGGGGGAGGINVSGTININSNNDTSVTFGMGGFGGAGNISGAVNVTQRGTVNVQGENAFGILAQSVAGGGGDGGLNVSANIANASAGKSTNRVVAGVGGTAGAGANAGAVTLTSVGAISVIGPTSASTPTDPGTGTTAFTAGGILAQSIGGGGGTGGMNISASVARNAGNTLQFGMGGSGGAGGNAGAVTVTRGYVTSGGLQVATPTLLSTVGDFNNGLVAQSVGGGGGMAGMNFNFAYNKESSSNPEEKKYTAAIISVGGSGADAGHAAAVTVIENGQITTHGAYANGLVAQAIGGGGGSSNINLGAGALGDKTKGINLGVGGANGAAGNGAAVTVDNVGTITTLGYASVGLKAQSIGGGGGSANSINQYVDPILDFFTGQLDSASLAINIGRAGGTGGTGGTVTVSSNGVIQTFGSQSIGLFAQSVGGGGGDSGTTTVGGDFSSKSGSYGGNVAIGLDGGVGATGGVVTVTTRGQIVTAGERSHTIFAQSLGGGGGMGGTVGDKLALSSVDDDVQSTTTADVNIGGKGGSGSFSSQVTVTNSALLQTSGDRSSGIWAQSVGGSGGAGGDYLQANIQSVAAGKTSRSFSVNVGGTGGTGATGGGVTVTNSARIQTLGLQSFGIRADSVGGGGGDGGAVSQGTLTLGTGSTQSVNINVGGSGGTGGAGGAVSVANTGTILTTGYGAEGIRATSTGGGGGNAGVMISALLRLTGGESQTQNVTFNYGGSGGTGGTGGAVTVSNTRTGALESGVIQTAGDYAHGIFAQSLGGGGGNGSSIISMTGLAGGKAAVSVGLNFGGSGGSGNTGGTVGVLSDGSITTTGQRAYGILAQSVGGGGGNGGLVLAVAAAFGEKGSAPLLSIGGFGGTGGNGGAVTVTNTGSIVTTGVESHGIVAQSIGGGGGNAGVAISATNDAATFFVSNVISLIAGALGGGTGGIGGTVNVVQNGSVTVTGAGAQAIVAEIINGGGGHLSFDLSGVAGMPGFSLKSQFADVFGIASTDGVSDPVIAMRLGGGGSSNMNAGKVTITSAGSFAATGRNGVASADQSIGGGGGTLYVTADQAPSQTAIVYTVALGGSALSNSSGAGIDNTHSGLIMTTGFNALGILSQSIGGGGGHAIVDVNTQADAIVGPFTLSLGGSSGTNVSGGNVRREQAGGIVTTQDLSIGAMIQSIGGGGGAGALITHGPGVIPGSSSTGAGADSQTGFNVRGGAAGSGSSAADVAPSMASNLTLGASGGSAQNGGNIASAFSGGVFTTGHYALGIVAQSIGAGGGEVQVSGGGAVSVALGGKNNAAGDGGNIALTNVGDVQTQGTRAHGVFLQSVGGGGGAVFTDSATGFVAYTLNAGNSGNGGAIEFSQTGNVLVHGDGAIGILAQSVGGGGGVVDRVFADRAGGTGSSGGITLAVNGSVVADGANAVGIFAQSRGSSGQGNLSIDLAAGQLIYTGANGVGVKFSGGAANLFTNAGIVIGSAGVKGWALIGEEGNERIENTGRIAGQVDLGTGVNTFVNHAGATLMSGAAFLLGGAGNQLVNSGLVSPGAINRDVTTTLTGSLVQTASGTYIVDLDLVGVTADRISATGTASVGGTVVVNLPNLFASVAHTTSGTRDLRIVSAAQGVTQQAIDLKALQTAVISHAIVYPNATDIVLRQVINFAGPASLSQNQISVGNAINTIQLQQQSPAFAPVALALFFETDPEVLARTYDLLGGSAGAGVAQLSFLSGDKFMSAVGRQTSSRVGLDAEHVLARENAARAARAGYAFLSTRPPAPARRWSGWISGVNDASSLAGSLQVGSTDSSQRGNGLAAGVDIRRRPDLRIGFATGFATYTFDADGFATNGKTTAQHVAGYIATERGPYYATGTFGMGFYDNSVGRSAVLPSTIVPVQPGDAPGSVPYMAFGAGENLTARFDSRSIDGSAEVGRRGRLWSLDLIPFGGVQFSHLHADAYTDSPDSGTSLIGLSHQAHNTWSVPAVAGIQLGGAAEITRKLRLSLFTRLAWRHEFRTDRTVENAFITAPDVTFLVHGAEPREDVVRANFDLRGVIVGRVSIYVNVQADASRGAKTDIARSFGLSMVW